MMKNRFGTSLILALLSLPALAQPGSGDIMVRMRALSIMPVETGSVAGGDITLSNTTVPEVDFSYFFDESFALELILATTTHKVGAYSTALGNLDLGSVSLLPPTLLAQYHKQFGKFKPYVGAGLNYTIFYGADSGSSAVNSVTYKDSFGYAFQVGGDYQIGEKVYLNFDIKKLYLSTDVNANHGAVKTQVNINPLIVGLGLGYQF